VLVLLLPGDVVDGRFEIVRHAGLGGMGAVYRARDRTTQEVIALKIVFGLKQRERFLREASALAGLRHPAIVRYVAHGAFEGALYLAMEWLDGEDLALYLTRGHLSVSATMTLARRIAEGLGIAHGQGIVHRDIKPANIFLPGGVLADAKLLDFGVARFTGSARAVTRAGTTVGTPGYMAPEQARGARDLDGRADIFALGCVLVECLTGQEAFSGRDITTVLAKILFDEPPRLQNLRVDIPPELDDLVGRMLAKDPAERPASALALIAELDALAGLPSSGHMGSSRRRTIALEEQRYVSVVVVGAAGAATPSLPGVGPALDVSPAGPVRGSDLALSARVESFGARFERLADGSAVAAVVGTRSARDQATQAAWCALTLREALPDAPIVLATGRAVVPEATMPVGEVIERAVAELRAARAEVAAPSIQPSTDGASVPEPIRTAPAPRPIRVDETTGRLLRGHFDVVRQGGCFVLRGEKRSSQTSRSLLGRLSPFVGRKLELSTLNTILAECESGLVAKAVIVTGPAGAGKSRLRREWLKDVARGDAAPRVLVGRGDPARAATQFALLTELVHDAAGIAVGMPLLEKQQLLSAHIGALLAPETAQRVTERLGELIGAPFADAWSPGLRAARANPSLLLHEMRQAWQDWLRAQCAGRTVVLVLEDLEASDPWSLEFLDHTLLVLEGCPLMVFALAGPELRERFPNVWRDRAAMEISLGPLPRDASERLVRETLGDSLHEETIALIVERAAGNPFFLEELIRFAWEGEEELPDTVLAVVQAQLDKQLDPATRRILRAGSVFGRTFWRGGVAAILGLKPDSAELARSLELLVAREVITRRPHSQFAEEEAYSFRHGLVRDTALGTLTAEDRRTAQSVAARWVEQASRTDDLESP
jgi:hypothetical protein